MAREVLVYSPTILLADFLIIIELLCENSAVDSNKLLAIFGALQQAEQRFSEEQIISYLAVFIIISNQIKMIRVALELNDQRSSISIITSALTTIEYLTSQLY